MIKQETFDKIVKEFNDTYVWIISFYKENGGITISDSHLEDEIHTKTDYEFLKSIPDYKHLFHFKVNKDRIDFTINNVPHSIAYNEDYYYKLNSTKTVWISARNYES